MGLGAAEHPNAANGAPLRRGQHWQGRGLLWRVLRRQAVTAIGDGQDLEKMMIGVSEIDGTTSVIGIDLTSLGTERIGPELDAALLHTIQDQIKVGLADEKSKMLPDDLFVRRIKEVQGGAVIHADHLKAMERRWRRQPKNLSQKRSGILLVAAMNNDVVNNDRHGLQPLITTDINRPNTIRQILHDSSTDKKSSLIQPHTSRTARSAP